jgi:hypothetical protein
MEEPLKDDTVLTHHLWNDEVGVQLTPLTHLLEKHPRHCTTPKYGVATPRPASRSSDGGKILGVKAPLAGAAF